MSRVYAALFGLVGGAIMALGQMSEAQLHTLGLNLLAITLAYGPTVLPWLLAIVCAWGWRRSTRRKIPRRAQARR